MMTTRIADSGLLVSRCMALAAQVSALQTDYTASQDSSRKQTPPQTPKLQNEIKTYIYIVFGQESGGIDLIFHTNTQSGKTSDLKSDSHVNISFLTPSGSWASISGTASVISDRSIVQKYYSPTLKTWLGDLGDGVHDGSENDPRIGVIKVKALTATYALPKGCRDDQGGADGRGCGCQRFEGD